MRSKLRPSLVVLLVSALGLLYVGAGRLYMALAAVPTTARVVEVYEVAQTDDVGTTYGCRFEFQPTGGPVVRGSTMVPPGIRPGDGLEVRYLPTAPAEYTASSLTGLWFWGGASVAGAVVLTWFAFRPAPAVVRSRGKRSKVS